MTRHNKKISRKIGLKPGSLVYVGDHRAEPVRISIIDYDQTNLTEKEAKSVEECYSYRNDATLTWINVDGLKQVDIVEKLGRHYGLHLLVMEDILNTGQRPKLEEGEDYIFVVLKMLYGKPDNGDLTAEQVSFIFGNSFVLSFQEKPGDVLDAVRDRLRKTVPRVRFMDADYLAYALIDAIVDNYFLVLETIGEKIEILEDRLLNNPSPQNLETLHHLKRELVFVRKAVWPLREVIGGLDRLESPLVHDATRMYLRDLYEHTIQVIDTVETYRDMVSGLLDIYLSSVSNRMNEVMKVLTIIATIFIPLSFLAGVYGMNFDTSASPLNMPELGMPYGYILFWGLVLTVGGGLVWFFKRKGWM